LRNVAKEVKRKKSKQPVSIYILIFNYLSEAVYVALGKNKYSKLPKCHFVA